MLAPLANRLGVWQLKWELEDLAFRCKSPDKFDAIADQLDEKRSDREAYLGELIAGLQQQLSESGIKADVSGRAKHIYSIWKKMQRKGVKFEQLSGCAGGQGSRRRRAWLLHGSRTGSSPVGAHYRRVR